MAKEVMLKTEFLKGWTAKAGEFPIFELTPGEGVSIENGVISIAQVDGVEGTYTNPIVTIDGYGRVSAIENGAAPTALNAEVLATSAEVDSYAGSADALLVLDSGDGRSALYMRGSDNSFQGPALITGERGSAGANGVDGATGAKGDKGDKGDQGERGPEGPQGQRGPSGEAGARGSDGLNGGEGPQGPQGPVGPMGSFLTPNEYGNLDEDSIARIVATQSGKDYFFLVNPDGDLRANKAVPSGISGDMSLHLVGKTSLGGWVDYGQLTGAQGVQGVQGIQGAQGERGPAGEQGPRGLQGVAGEKGERGIAGQDGLQGVRGEKGDVGATGAQGPQGERGLQGVQGVAGPQGVKGDTGDTGPQGPAGADGEVGPSGPPGLSGASRVLLREVTSTVAGPEDFATGINASQYDHIYVTFTGFFSSDATAVMTLRLGNGSYLSSGYYSTVDSDASVNATAHIILSGGGSTSLDRSSGEVMLRLNREVCIGHSRRSSGSTPGVRRIVSILPSIANFNQLRFSASSGSMGAGVTIRVYGVR